MLGFLSRLQYGQEIKPVLAVTSWEANTGFCQYPPAETKEEKD